MTADTTTPRVPAWDVPAIHVYQPAAVSHQRAGQGRVCPNDRLASDMSAVQAALFYPGTGTRLSPLAARVPAFIPCAPHYGRVQLRT
jgi:hypothetical protein